MSLPPPPARIFPLNWVWIKTNMLSIRRSPLRGFWNACSDYVAPKTWDLTVQTTDVNQTFTVDINAGLNPNVNVDWDDGTVETFTTTGQKTHTYSSAGIYKIRIGASFTSGGNIRFGSDAENKHRLKKTSIIPFIKGLTNFSSTFNGCTGLSGSIPADLFRYNTLVSTSGFYGTFFGCSGLTGSLPTDLFRYNPLVSTGGFSQTFQGCTGLTGSLPADLFRYNTLVSTSGFYATFSGCSGLTGSLPADLFRYNTQVSTSGFYATFSGCSGLTGSLPSDFFRYNTQVSTYGFCVTFAGCTGLTGSLPDDLFKYNTLVSINGFFQTLLNCTGLTGSIPADFFRYNTLVSASGFSQTFRACTKLSLSPNIFGPPEEYATRFLNTPSNFTNCFYNTGTLAAKGTAPALWLYDYGTETPVKTGCFYGQTTNTVTNFADIPADWK